MIRQVRREKNETPDELDIGFKVFKLDSSNIKEWNQVSMRTFNKL